jgi:hypothetical protein
MKQTAVEWLIEYFIKQQKEGCSHWCIHDLIAQLYVAKEMEKEQIIEAFEHIDFNLDDGLHYYTETYESNTRI